MLCNALGPRHSKNNGPFASSLRGRLTAESWSVILHLYPSKLDPHYPAWYLETLFDKWNEFCCTTNEDLMKQIRLKAHSGSTCLQIVNFIQDKAYQQVIIWTQCTSSLHQIYDGNTALFEEPGCNDRNVYHVTKLRMKYRLWLCQESVKESFGFRVWTKAKWFFRQLFGSAPWVSYSCAELFGWEECGWWRTDVAFPCSLELPHLLQSKKLINLLMCMWMTWRQFPFFWVNFVWCSQSVDHPYEDLAKLC